jgi:hypothetical protein
MIPVVIFSEMFAQLLDYLLPILSAADSMRVTIHGRRAHGSIWCIGGIDADT